MPHVFGIAEWENFDGSRDACHLRSEFFNRTDIEKAFRSAFEEAMTKEGGPSSKKDFTVQMTVYE